MADSVQSETLAAVARFNPAFDRQAVDGVMVATAELREAELREGLARERHLGRGDWPLGRHGFLFDRDEVAQLTRPITHRGADFNQRVQPAA